MRRSLVDLRSRAARSEALVGGKASGLACLSHHGFAVPPGCVVVFTSGSAELSSLVENQIRRWYRGFGGKVAVRSSMVGEDSGTASFAGQLETLLNVETEDNVIEAVKRCAASLYGHRVAHYRVAAGPRGEHAVSGGVIIQRMHDALVAGVAFSTDPITGRPQVVIEAARGPGNQVVGGRADADRFVVDHQGELTEHRPVDPEHPVLGRTLVQQLAHTVTQIAETLGGARDVEWLWDGSRFVFLQARPITALRDRHVYSSRLTADMMPGLIRPLVWSTNALSMSRNIIGRFFRELLGPTDFDFTSLVRPIHSRVYADMTALGELFERIGLPANFLEMVARDERAKRGRPPVNTTLLRSALRFGRFAFKERKLAQRAQQFLVQHHSHLEPYRVSPWRTESPAELLNAFNSLMTLHRTTQWMIFLCALNMNIRNRILTAWIRKRVTGIVPSDLLRGLLGLKALEPNFLIQQMGRQARALGEGIPELLTQEVDCAIRDTLAGTNAGRELIGAVETFMRTYGFLSANGTDFAGIPWVENPKLIWSAIGRAALSHMEETRVEAGAVREGTLKKVRAEMDVLRRFLFDKLLTSTISYIHLRERVSLYMSEDAFQMRRIALALGERSVAQNLFTAKEDVFLLTYEELVAMVGGMLGADRVREILTDRKNELETDRHLQLDEILFGARQSVGEPVQNHDAEYLEGLTGSSGTAQGFARIVWDPAQVTDALTRNDILVVPFSDVGWTPLFYGIGGIVAETGGQLSHTSIVAREYNLPAVVSVKHATRLIKDGQAIRIDADAGRVYLSHFPGGGR